MFGLAAATLSCAQRSEGPIERPSDPGQRSASPELLCFRPRDDLGDTGGGQVHRVYVMSSSRCHEGVSTLPAPQIKHREFRLCRVEERDELVEGLATSIPAALVHLLIVRHVFRSLVQPAQRFCK